MDNRVKPLPQPFDSTSFVADGIFSKEECSQLIDRIQNPTHINGLEDGTQRIVDRTSLKVKYIISQI
jgi:hypothetical protein